MDSNKCSGCSAVIYDILFMECSEGICKKLYHLKCLNITKEKFEAFTHEYKANWVCPECVKVRPKTDNTNTPARSHIIFNKTFTPISYVNAERGSHNEDLSIIMDTETKVLKELQDFRSETNMRMDEQSKKYELLYNQFMKIESELRDVHKNMTVGRKNDEKVKLLQTENQLLRDKILQLEAKLSAKATVGKEKQDGKSYASTVSSTLQRNKNQCGATKPDMIKEQKDKSNSNMNRISQNFIIEGDVEEFGEGEKIPTLESLTGEKKVQNLEGEWTVINRNKRRYPSSEVKKGGLEAQSGIEIQGTERKKYLHVWRLRKETTIENMETYIKKLFKEDISMKVDRIKHKTERDYASFIVGVPESRYQELCSPQNWPVNVEFCEWVWFRRSGFGKPNPSKLI